MADNDKRKFDLPWATLLPVAAVLAGIVVQYKPLVSERPSVPIEKTASVIAAQDVDARLWQDPIGVTQKQKSLLDEQIEKGVVKQGSAESHDICALTHRLSQSVSRFPGHVLLLAVMLDAGPYSEQAESRLRARPAVLEGLSESGFVPIDAEHIGFGTATWPPPEANVPAPAIERALLLPWEECEAINDSKNVFPEDTKRVFVAWLPTVNFNANPLRCFAALIDQLVPTEIRDKINVKLIGPPNATGLHTMRREAAWDPLWQVNSEASLAMEKGLDGVSIISPRATASDDELFFTADLPMLSASNLPMLPRENPIKVALEQFTAAVPRGLHFVRTVTPDDWVLDRLIKELARRDIYVSSQMTPDGRPIPSKLSHVVILSEWDTLYGRSLGKTFAVKAFAPTANIIERPDRPSDWIHPYYYLQGIDGRLPGDSGKDNQREQEQKSPLGQNTVAIEATEGLNQSDYLRRLARQMKEHDAQWQREDGSGIRAIGLLGSDVYDKLMILRALRPQFPDAVFFTNNYDAHLERRDDWYVTHNLVIASPFGSTVPEIYIEQRHVPPFRDNNQTSMYLGTLVATGRMTEEEAKYLSWQPRIFEISRRGAYDLSPPWYRWRP